MIYDFIALEKKSGSPLYIQLYNAIKTAIEDGALAHGEKLPSIRRLSKDLSLSKTTIESAYLQLCVEGYIKNEPQRGYFVQAQTSLYREEPHHADNVQNAQQSPRAVKYDLGGRSVAVNEASLRLWRKYIREVLNCEYLINSYGDPQGEPELRRALASYSYGVRGAVAGEQNIVIGAGTQPLLYLICGLLRSYGDTVAVEKNGSRHAMQVFSDCGFRIEKIESDGDGVLPGKLYGSKADFLLINPSGSLKTGRSIQMNRRFELLRWAEEQNGFILEDDYNGELRYNTRPIPALQGHDRERVIYLGSFSKLLLPSVRLGYAVLPQILTQRFRERAAFYNQTASKTEQLALARYISDGQLERHLRRLRGQYAEKSAALLQALKKYMPEDTALKLLETSLAVEVTLGTPLDQSLFYERLLLQGVRILPDTAAVSPSFKLGFSGIPADQIEPAVQIISGIIKSASISGCAHV